MNLVMSLATARTPAGLADFRATRTGVDDQQVSYCIGCRCGGEVGTIISEYHPDEQFWADPLVFQCALCGFSAIFFDSRRDGYDAVVNAFSAYSPRTTNERVKCSSCSSEHHILLAFYGYQFEDWEIDQEWSGEERARMPDVFDSAAFALKCSRCGEQQWLAEFECA